MFRTHYEYTCVFGLQGSITYIFWYARVMATNDIHQRVALHCFNNLVQFMTIHKFEIDWKSVAWRKSFLNISLSGIDALHVMNGLKEFQCNTDRYSATNAYIYPPTYQYISSIFNRSGSGCASHQRAFTSHMKRYSSTCSWMSTQFIVAL